MSRIIRWGVLGCARIATRRVIPAIVAAAGAELAAVASRSSARASETASQFGIATSYDSYEALLADPGLDVVYIPLPNSLHKPWTIAALQAGKHVLCEKPMAMNAAEAREMAAAAAETGLFLVEAFMYRYGPLMDKAIEIVRDGRLGELRSLYSSFTFRIADDPQNVRLQPETGGGALYDVGCYALDVQRLLAGREPRSVWAQARVSEVYGVDMSIAGVLDYGQGLRGTFEAGFDAPGWTSLRAVGTEGTLEAPQGFNPRNEAGLLILRRGSLVERLVIPPADLYQLEIEDLCAAIRGARPPRFADRPLEANMRVIDACYASAKQGVAIQV